jgi:hypothetical protein
MVIIEIAEGNGHSNNKKQDAANGKPKFFHKMMISVPAKIISGFNNLRIAAIALESPVI